MATAPETAEPAGPATHTESTTATPQSHDGQATQHLEPPSASASHGTTSTASDNAAAQPTRSTASTEGERNDGIDVVNPKDFRGEVNTNNELPSLEILHKIESYVVLDQHGKSHTFKSLYSGRNAPRRVLVIFVRHFYCGICQEYLRTLSQSVTPDALLRLPISTFIAIVGCGDPALIPMYTEATGCPFPIYTDPTRELYNDLGMVKTLNSGSKPAYMSTSMWSSTIGGIMQGLKQIKNGLALKSGDMRQIGGEFLFEPLSIMTPTDEVDRQLGKSRASLAEVYGLHEPNKAVGAEGGSSTDPITSAPEGTAGGAAKKTDIVADGAVDGAADGDDVAEEKRVTWCHRMKTTRDHAEMPEILEVLGLDNQGHPIKDQKRWSKALKERKGTGLSMASQMNDLRAQASGT